jgi:hypothetical protein
VREFHPLPKQQKVERRLPWSPVKVQSNLQPSDEGAKQDSVTMIPCGIYCVASSEHYIGLVALVNSLRLTGNDLPVFVTDCGLTACQRERLAPHVALVEVDDQRSPHLAKWAGPLAHPAEVSILLDADIVALRSLDPLVGVAQHRPLVFADPLWHRFDENWGRLLGLGPLRRGTYFNAGVIALPARRAAELLPVVATAQRRIDTDKTWLNSGGQPGYPFYFGDQDVWNAVFAARLAPNELLVFEQRLAVHPPFPRLRLHDTQTLDCRYPDGAVPFFLHHVGKKPWLAQTRPNIYSRLLTRLLLSDDLELRLDSGEVPWRLRGRATGDAGRAYAATSASLYGLRGHLGIRRRLRGNKVAGLTSRAIEPPTARVVEPDTMAREA